MIQSNVRGGQSLPFGHRRKKVLIYCEWCHEPKWTSQENTRFCSDLHRNYAWREKRRQEAAETKKATARVVAE